MTVTITPKKVKTKFEKTVDKALNNYQADMEALVINQKTGKPLVSEKARIRLRSGFIKWKATIRKGWKEWNEIVDREVSVVIVKREKQE